jgi:hypothetical protein
MFNFAKEAFDQMALLVNKPIARARMISMAFRRNDRLQSFFVVNPPFDRTSASASDELPAAPAANTRVCSNDRAVEQYVLQIRVSAAACMQTLLHILFAPPREAFEYGIPFAQ